MMNDGVIILRHTKFKWHNLGTYIPALIRIFQNLYNKNNCSWNHVGIASKHKGIYYIYEAVENGLQKTTMIEYLKNTDKYEYLILRPNFHIDNTVINTICESLLKTKYDYVGTLWIQLIRQITDERLLIGPKSETKAKKRMYCSEFVAYVFFIATNNKNYENWKYTDVEDFYKDYNEKFLYKKLYYK